MPAASDAGTKPVRVVLVDDAEDLRMILRIQFGRDSRFEVVGEAGDGQEAIAVAEREQPDLMILDRQMPVLGGLEAMPEIRAVSPNTAIVLYTANADPGTYQAALDAGALDVLQKAGSGGGLVERLVDTLAERAADGMATTDLRVGPVSSQAARVWVANTSKIIEAVAAHPEVIGTPIPEDVLELFRSLLGQWRALAESTDEFRWVAKANPSDVSRIVEHWAEVDAMTDEQLQRLGVHWSPPEGQPFFQALTTGVLDALRRHDESTRLAARVLEQWAPYRTGTDAD
jgi:DNA-binding NarL/FixJ family response regulator